MHKIQQANKGQRPRGTRGAGETERTLVIFEVKGGCNSGFPSLNMSTGLHLIRFSQLSRANPRVEDRVLGSRSRTE